MSHRDNVKQLIINHQRRLQKLKEQQAIKGVDTPPHVLIEIEDIETKLEKLNAELEAPDQPKIPLTLYYQYQDRPEKAYHASDQEVIIGRPKNIPVDLNLEPDQKVSRPHARLYYSLSTWWVEDLHSKRGTVLNGRTITQATELSPGDQLQLGDTVVRVEFASTETLPPTGLFESHATVDEIEPAPTTSEDKRIELLAEITTIVANTASDQAKLDRFVNLIRRAFPQSDHQSLLVIDHDKELIPRAPLAGGPVQVSFTLARRAIKSCETIYWERDIAGDGGRIESLYDTTAALCAPMLSNGRIIGAVYLDSRQPEATFDNHARDLLSEIATAMAPWVETLTRSRVVANFPKIFISYAPQDRTFVDRLAGDLRRHRIKVWFDERLRVGDDRQREISRAIEITDGFVLVMSAESVTSPQVLEELAAAQEKQKKIYPLMLQPCQPPAPIKNLVHLDMTPTVYKNSLAELAEVINGIPKSELAVPSGSPAGPVSPPNNAGRPAIVQPSPVIEKVAPTYILMLAANPRDTDPLRLGEEARTIKERIRQTEFRDRFEVVTEWAVRHTDLSEYLLLYNPQIVHFSGHGNKAGRIILEDATGHGQTVTAEALRRLFRILKDNIRCVVLNACMSITQAEAIVKEIDCVIGMSEKIGDEAAIRFAGGFYRALGYGRSVQTAFELGRNEIDLSKLGEEEKPQLLVRPGVNAAKIYFI